ncbi:MAG: TatD family hydrolase [Gammaproteobacteria bacterium]|nr:TatD family hydrolase [Gammaproteobacteria bacterium]
MILDMNKYIDIGVNLTASSFRNDVPQTIDRAQQAGVDSLIITGTNIQHSEKAIVLTQQFESICFSTVGLHPHHASDYCSELGSELRDMLSHKSAVAVGECGLDFNRNYSPRKDQIKAFEAQLEIAIEIQKPVFLHQRDAHEDVVAILKGCRRELKQVVAHCFTGTIEELNDYLALDIYVGLTGWICDERRGKSLQQAVKHVPLDRVMLETDAPYLLPRDLQQKPVEKNRNEPCFLPHIARSVAKYMTLQEKQLAKAAYENSCDFFGINQDAALAGIG